MKLSIAAAAFVSLNLPASILCQSVNNLGFEDGNFGGWSQYLTKVYPSPSVQASFDGKTAEYGTRFAVLPGGCKTNQLYRTIDGSDLCTVVGSGAWNGNDYLPYDDYGKIQIEGENAETLYQASIYKYGNYGSGPWVQFRHNLDPMKHYTLRVISTNKLDCAVTSNVLADFAEIVVNPGGPYIIYVDDSLPNDNLDGCLTSDIAGVTSNWSLDCSNGATGVFSDTGSLTSSLSFPAGTEPGVCKLTLNAVDEYGNVLDIASTKVVIVDPQAGFVTGGGWIQSPEGAYADDLTMIGPAEFGFVSRYKKGQSVPSGETYFEFQTGSFVFQSTGYDWLVISGNDCAKYKGVGIVNEGTEEYGFLLTACDNGEGQNAEEKDTFRIKIWDVATDVVKYDNKVISANIDDDSYEGTYISGGNIQIHGGKNRRHLREFVH